MRLTLVSRHTDSLFGNGRNIFIFSQHLHHKNGESWMNLVWFMSINPFWWRLSRLHRGWWRYEEASHVRRECCTLHRMHTSSPVCVKGPLGSLVTYCPLIMDVVGQCWCCGSKCDVVSWESSLMTILWPDTRHPEPVGNQSEASILSLLTNQRRVDSDNTLPSGYLQPNTDIGTETPLQHEILLPPRVQNKYLLLTLLSPNSFPVLSLYPPPQ